MGFSRDDDSNLNITVYENGVPLPCRVWVYPTWEMRVSAFNNSSYVKRLRADIKDADFNIKKSVLNDSHIEVREKVQVFNVQIILSRGWIVC